MAHLRAWYSSMPICATIPALSSLRSNKTLKSLIIELKDGTKSSLSAFFIDIAAMMQENASLESLSVGQSRNSSTIDDYFVLVTALQHNTTLKYLNLKATPTASSGGGQQEQPSVPKGGKDSRRRFACLDSTGLGNDASIIHICTVVLAMIGITGIVTVHGPPKQINAELKL
jgi:hypothetical protein